MSCDRTHRSICVSISESESVRSEASHGVDGEVAKHVQIVPGIIVPFDRVKETEPRTEVPSLPDRVATLSIMGCD